MFDIAQVLTPLMIFVSYGLTAILVAGAWWASGRAGLEPGERRATVASLGLLLLAWQTGVAWLAQQGAFLAAPDRVAPLIALAIFLPVPIALGLIAMNSRLRRIVEAVPLSALVGVQFYRVLGAIFLALGGRAVSPASLRSRQASATCSSGWRPSALPAPLHIRPATLGDWRRFGTRSGLSTSSWPLPPAS